MALHEFILQNNIQVAHNNSDTAIKIKEMLVELEGVELNEITDDSDLVTDIGMDDLDLVEFIVQLETRFGISLPDNILPEFPDETLGMSYDDKLAWIKDNVFKIKDEIESKMNESEDGEIDEEKLDIINEINEQLKEIIDEANEIKSRAIEISAERIDALKDQVFKVKSELYGFSGYWHGTVAEVAACVDYFIKQSSSQA